MIGLTANADEIALREALAAGMCNLVPKPTKGVVLKTAIEDAIKEHGYNHLR